MSSSDDPVNSLDPDQALRADLGLNCLTLMVFLTLTSKNQQTTKRHVKLSNRHEYSKNDA